MAPYARVHLLMNPSCASFIQKVFASTKKNAISPMLNLTVKNILNTESVTEQTVPTDTDKTVSFITAKKVVKEEKVAPFCIDIWQQKIQQKII